MNIRCVSNEPRPSRLSQPFCVENHLLLFLKAKVLFVAYTNLNGIEDCSPVPVSDERSRFTKPDCNLVCLHPAGRCVPGLVLEDVTTFPNDDSDVPETKGAFEFIENNNIYKRVSNIIVNLFCTRYIPQETCLNKVFAKTLHTNIIPLCKHKLRVPVNRQVNWDRQRNEYNFLVSKNNYLLNSSHQ